MRGESELSRELSGLIALGRRGRSSTLSLTLGLGFFPGHDGLPLGLAQAMAAVTVLATAATAPTDVFRIFLNTHGSPRKNGALCLGDGPSAQTSTTSDTSTAIRREAP